MFNELIKIIKEKQRFIITTHINPDGDGLGSEIAFFHLLKNLKKDVHLINQDPLLECYSFLDKGNNIHAYNRDAHHELFTAADVLLIIDLSSANRLGVVEEELNNNQLYSVCFDHHPPVKKFADLHVVNEKASSIGEMIFFLIKEMKLNITKEIATGIYVSILTDTGSFRYSNTSPETHQIAAELLKYEIEPQKIYQYIYENNSYQKIVLLGMTLNSLMVDETGKLAWAVITQKVLKESGAHLEDKEGFIEILRTLKGIEVVILFSETEDNITKVSMRSKGNIDVNQIISKFGGGGHPFAAGATIKGEQIEPTVQKILKETSNSIRALI